MIPIKNKMGVFLESDWLILDFVIKNELTKLHLLCYLLGQQIIISKKMINFV